MLYPDLQDLSVDVFGGYTPSVPPSDLPTGAAVVAQDVMFPQGGVRTRGGLSNPFLSSPVGATVSVNGLKSYLTPTLGKRLLAWDAGGSLYKENPQGNLNLVASRPYRGLRCESQTLFGREYQAFFDGNGGFDIPRQFDDTNWDRVSQVGPGAAPGVADENNSAAIDNPNGILGDITFAGLINSGTEVGYVVTIVMAGAITGNGYQVNVGDVFTISGTAVTGIDGSWKFSWISADGKSFQFVSSTLDIPALGAGGTLTLAIAAVITATNPAFVVGQSVTVAGSSAAFYNAAWPVRGYVFSNPKWITYIYVGSTGNGNSNGGTVTATGNIAAGIHQISVAFITRQGFITQAAPPVSWTAAGSKRAVVSSLPIGPANVVARLILFTPVITPPAATGSFYSLPNGSSAVSTSTMLVNDNTTTTTTVDFTDAILIAGFSANYLFTQQELGESAFFIPYNSRTVWMGERAKVTNFLNLTFDGGFGADIPLGWYPGTGVAGGSSAIASGYTADWGDAYAITGDGVTGTRGKIQQSAYQDYLGVAIIQKNTSYSVRARIARSAGLANCNFHINLQSTSGGFTTAGLLVTAAQLSTTYAEFTATLTDVPLASPPSDLILQVYADFTPNNGEAFLVDSIEVFAVNNPYNYSTARISHAFNPESFDGVTGQVQVRPGDGQGLRAAFPIRGNLYLAKDHYLGYVTDDGANEPSSWQFTEVSSTVGICGPNAVDWTEEWAVFAERSGLYLCYGSDPIQISQEIQTDASGTGKICWNSINWQYGHTIWVRIDQTNKYLLVGAPVNGATSPNVVFMLDYKWLETAPDVATTELVSYSAFTGKLNAHGKGRRFSIWNITANSMCFAERADGTTQPFFGNGTNNGKIYQQVDCSLQPSDDGTMIDSRYQTYAMPSPGEEQGLQLGAHRKLFGYLKFLARGVGSLALSVGTAQRTTILRAYTLSTNPVGDGERPVNVHGERFYLTVGTSAVGSWFQLEKLIGCLRKDASIPVRGVSS